MRLIFAILILSFFYISSAYAQPFAYVTNSFSDNVSIIDISTNTVIDTITTGLNPIGVAISQDGDTVYIANRGSDTVSIMRTSDNKVVADADLSYFPIAVAASPKSNGLAYVAGEEFSVIEGVTAVKTFRITGTAIAVKPEGNFIYVADSASEEVIVLDGAGLFVELVDIEASPLSIAVTPDGDFVYVGTDIGRVEVISTSDNKVIDMVIVDGFGDFTGVVVTPDGDFVYAVNQTSNNVFVIDTSDNSVVDTVDVGTIGDLAGVAVTPDGDFVYVVGQVSNSVFVIDTSDNSVVDTVNVGTGPIAIAITSSAGLGSSMGNSGGSCTLASFQAVNFSFHVYLLIPAFILIARLWRARIE